MRFESLLFFTILFIVGSVHGLDNSTGIPEACRPDKCLEPHKCEVIWSGATCPNKCHSCCSVVKQQFRTLCSHHDGECMDWCGPAVRRPAKDCPGRMCCVLV